MSKSQIVRESQAIRSITGQLEKLDTIEQRQRVLQFVNSSFNETAMAVYAARAPQPATPAQPAAS